MSAFPDIKMRGNGQIGKKGCRQKKGISGKLADIDVSARHVADMSPTFPTKINYSISATFRRFRRLRRLRQRLPPASRTLPRTAMTTTTKTTTAPGRGRTRQPSATAGQLSLC